MTKTTMTQKMALDYAIANLSNAPVEIMDKLKAMRVQLDRKSHSEKTKKVDEKKTALKSLLVEYLKTFDRIEYPDGMTVAEIMATYPEFNPSLEMTSQKVTRMLIEIAEETGTIRTEVVKGRKRYRIDEAIN